MQSNYEANPTFALENSNQGFDLEIRHIVPVTKKR